MMMTEPQTFTVLRGTLARRLARPLHELALRRRAAIASTFRPTATISRRSCASCRADEPLTVIGLGSNLLVRDGGVRGTVVVLHAALNALELRRRLIHAEAGVASPKVARFAATHGFADAEFLAGIPGTVGGALAMNAGCYGGETWRYVARVEVLTRAGTFEVRAASAYAIGYRTVRRADGGAPDDIFTAAWFAFPPGDGGAARERIAELLQAAHRDAAAQSAECRQRVPQSAGRSRGAPDRELRPQGLRDRRRARVGEAREFHRQSRTARRRPPTSKRSSRTCATRARAGRASISCPKCGRGGSRHERIRQSGRADGRARRRSARSRSCPAMPCWRRSAKRASTRMRSIRRSGRSSTSKRERLRSRLHRAARPLRRGRHRAGRARDAGHSLHRQRRDGLRARDGQVAHQARVARERHSDAALSPSSTPAPTGCASSPSSACRSS